MAEDLITRYQLDISDLRLQVKQLEDQFKKLTDAEKKSAKEGEEAFKKTGDAVEDTNNKTSKLDEKLVSLGKTIIAAFAVERIIAFGAESVRAFAEAERNALKLKTAVGINGGVASDFNTLLNQSSELQKRSIFDDDAIQNVQTAALQFGLTTEEVQKLTPILLDFASATGQDLNSALSVVISGVNGATRGLKQYGISVDANSTAQDRYNQILEQANQKFAGQAELIANQTTLGAIEKLSNAWGDFTESIGEFIATRTNLTSYLSAFTEIIRNGFDISNARIAKFTNESLPLADNVVTRFGERYKKLIDAAGKDSADVTKNIVADIDKQIVKNQESVKKLQEAVKNQSGDAQLKTEQDIGLQNALITKYSELKITIQDYNKKRTEGEINYSKLSTQQLEKLAETNNVFATKELERRKELAQKSAEQNKKEVEERKKSLDELNKIADDANRKALETAVKTEEEKLRLQREGALQQAQLLLERAGGETNLEAVKAYNEAVLAIEKNYAELIKNAKVKATSDYYSEQLKLAEQNSQQELTTTLNNIESNQTAQILALKEAYLAKGDFSVEAEKKLQDDITKIQLDAERKRADETFKLKEAAIEKERLLQLQSAIQTSQQQSGLIGLQLLQSLQFQQAVTDANKNANDKKFQNDKEYADALAKLGLKIVDGQIVVASKGLEIDKVTTEEKIQAAQQATGELLALLNTLTQNQITAKEQELTRLQEGYDAEDAELQRRYELRLIGAAEFEIQQDRIKQERLKSEKKLNDEIIKLKKQQDIANRAQAVFDIIINTAVAVTNALKTSAFLAVAIGIAGAAQLTAVLATPLPKYAKGTKYLQRGNNPAGTDTIPILANEGERIIPTDRNKKYWSIYEAIDGNKFDEFISRKYIAPALQRQMNDYKKSESLSFAENISNSLIFNHDLLASKIGSEIEWRNRNGIKVKGMQDLIDALTTTTDLRKR